MTRIVSLAVLSAVMIVAPIATADPSRVPAASDRDVAQLKVAVTRPKRGRLLELTDGFIGRVDKAFGPRRAEALKAIRDPARAAKAFADLQADAEAHYSAAQKAWRQAIEQASGAAPKKDLAPWLPGSGAAGRARWRKALSAGAAPPATFGQFAKLNHAERVMVAELLSVQWGPVGRSFPPVYTATLQFKTAETLRGPGGKGRQFQAGFTARQQKRPGLPAGRYVVVLERSRGRLRAKSLTPLTDARLAEARAATAMPIGFQPGDRGRWLVGKGVTLTVENVPPQKTIRWTNPDGDGEYRLTVTNTTEADQPVPALRTDGKRILWAESIRILCQDKVRRAPGSEPMPAGTSPVVLKPAQSVSAVMNVLILPEIKWPRGGYRIDFRFCLGELAVTKSMYYISRHHDKLRQEAVKKLGTPDRAP